jgi:hypothetical protein
VGVDVLEGLPPWAGNLTAGAALMVVALLAVTGKLLWHKWVERQLDELKKQRDDAMAVTREALEINRIHAEAYRELSQTVDTIADGQAVTLKLIQALPRPDGGAST